MDAILKCNSCGEEVRLDVGLVDDRSQVIAFCASHQEHATGGFSLLIPRSVLTALTTTHHEPGLAKPPTGITLAHAVWGSTEPVTVHVVVADGSSLCGTASADQLRRMDDVPWDDVTAGSRCDACASFIAWMRPRS